MMIAFLSMMGCEGDGGGNSGPAEGVDITGRWAGRSSDGVTFTANFTQAGGNVNGSVRRGDGIAGVASGTISGTAFEMRIIWDIGGTGVYKGTISGNALDGTFSETLGSANLTGTFTAFKQ